MFIRDYSLNVMIDCNDAYFYACPDRDFESLVIWCMGA